jgi:hypothetical protein
MTDWVTYLGVAILVLKVDNLFGSKFTFMFGSAIWEFACFKFLPHFHRRTFRWNAPPGIGIAVDQKWVSWEILEINCGLGIKSRISRQLRPESLVIGDG